MQVITLKLVEYLILDISKFMISAYENYFLTMSMFWRCLDTMEEAIMIFHSSSSSWGGRLSFVRENELIMFYTL